MIRQDIEVDKWITDLQLIIRANKYTYAFDAEIYLWVDDYTKTLVAKWDYEDKKLRLIIYPSALMENRGYAIDFMNLIYYGETIIGDRDE